MNAYRSLTAAAGHVRTDEQTLLEFGRAGWIKVILKNGTNFVSSHDEYRSRFILHLREKMKLSDQQIAIVLENGKPPYSLDQVPKILASYHASTRGDLDRSSYERS
jgi:hypothetical protein